ncbi:MAG: OmpA family protein [Gemmatimonadales bacterium]|nr:OmpA family protein [Gemmatimonadales bacterium]
MKRFSFLLAGLALLLLLIGQAWAVDQTGFKKLETDMDAARLAEANIFAPKTWEKATKAYEKARKDISEQKKQGNLDKHVAEAAEYTANAVKAAEVCKLSLQEYLEPRTLALASGGPARVPVLYQEAEKQFTKATKKVEEGDVKGALKEAEKSRPLFDTAEMEAIRIEVLGAADLLIAKAIADEAEKFAVTTLDKAQGARSRANTVLTSDRYNRTETVADAELAEYEAKHASSIAKSVRSLNRNDQAWEKLMLGYEIQMNRAGETFGHQHLAFDNGPEAAATQLIDDVLAMQTENQNLNAQLQGVVATIKESLSRVQAESPSEDPVELADLLDREILTMVFARRDLSKKLEAGQADMAVLAKQQKKVESELAARRDKEDKFMKAKRLLNPSEGHVLFNPANDIVMRLHGLSFDVGQSEIQDPHVNLLAKVQEIIKMYPEKQLIIEGHTDLSGDSQANMTLSEKRAYAVMQYLRHSMMLSSDKVRAIGYGADRPVASNKTKEGRAKNRRIDIIVMQ